MPYVYTEARDRLYFNPRDPETPGELNYVITLLLNKFIREHGKNYETLNKVVGVLECAKLELYRRVVAPYEDEKCKENGDVY